MKHADGTDYVLCPKVATERMVKDMDGWTDLIDGSTAGADEMSIADKNMARHEEFSLAWKVAVKAAPPYEPSDEVVERVAKAIYLRHPESVGWNNAINDTHVRFREYARAAIRAFVGGE